MSAKEITAAAIAHCGGMTAARRDGWVKHGLRDKPPFSEFDAIETAVARKISETTNQKRATVAFRYLRKPLKKAIFAGHTKLWAVVPTEGHGFRLEASSAKALKMAVQANGPLWIVALDGAIRDAKERYAEYISELKVADGVLRSFPVSKASDMD